MKKHHNHFKMLRQEIVGFILLGLTTIFNIHCIRDKTTGSEIIKPLEITFQKLSIDSLDVRRVITDNSGIMFVSTKTGLFRSIDQGETWDLVLSQYAVFCMAFKDNGYIFACYGTSPWGPAYILRSPNNGLTWDLLPNPGIYPSCFVINQSGEIFLGDVGGEDVWKGDVYKSTDNGDTWQRTNFPDSVGVRAMIINKKEDIFVGTLNGIYRSIDNGNTWTRVNNGFEDKVNSIGVSELALNPVNNHIYAVLSYKSEIYRSTDNGDSWTKTGLQTSTPIISSLAINSKGDIFVGLEKSNLPDKVGVYYSADNGDNWKECNDGLTNTTVFSISIDYYGFLYAITEDGLFRTKYSTVE